MNLRYDYSSLKVCSVSESESNVAASSAVRELVPKKESDFDSVTVVWL